MPDIDILLRNRATGVDQINKTGAAISKTEKSVKNYNTSYKSMIKTIVGSAAIIAGARKAWDFLTGSIDLAAEQEAAIKQLETTIESTGMAAGLTSEELQAMAASMQDVTTFGDEAVIRAQALQLTFKNIGEEIFPQVTESILDVATAMGTDLRSATVQVGKVMNDPIANLGALSRSGIQFSDSQKEMIKQMQKSGNLMGAQKIILKELQSQFGGSARAAAQTFGGAMKQASNIIGDAREELGARLMPVLKDIAKFVIENKDSIIGFFGGLADILVVTAKAFLEVTKAAGTFSTGIIATVGDLSVFEDEINDLNKNIEKSKKNLKGFGDSASAAGRQFGRGGNFSTGISAAIDLSNDLTASDQELTEALDMAVESLGNYTEGWEGLLPKLHDAKEEGKHLEFQTDDLTDAEGRAAEATHILQAALTSLEDLGVIPAGLARAFDAVKSSIAGVSSGMKLLESGKGLDKILGGLSIAGGAVGIFGAAVDVFGSIFGGKEEGPTWAEQVEANVEVAGDALKRFGIDIQLSEEAMRQLSATILQFTSANKTATQAVEAFLLTNKAAQKQILSHSDTQNALNDFLAVGAKSQQEFNAQSNITMNIFAGLFRAGTPIIEIIDIMDESFGKLIDTQKELGFTADETFQELAKFRELVRANEELIDSAIALNKIFETQKSLIEFTQKSFDDFAGLALQKFADLIAAGFSEAQAMQVLGPLFQNLGKEAEKSGFAIDDNLQGLIDMADSSGMFGSVQGILTDIKDIMLEMVSILRGELPDAVKDFTKGAEKDFKNLQDVTGVGTGVAAGETPAPPVRGFQSGTDGFREVPPGFPNDSFRVGLSSGERFNVIPASDTGTRSERPVTINVYLKGTNKDEDARNFIAAYKSNHLGMRTETTG